MSGNVAADELRLGIQRILRLEEEKKGIADDIKDVYAEYKSKGYDTKTMREIVKLSKMTPDDRREREALLDTYKAALGMLDGTPLGKWAIDRLSKPEDEKQDDADEAGDDGQGDAADTPQEPSEPPLTTDDAKRMGAEAAAAGKPVTSNPFPARDTRRAAWDEAWCHALGSDGMDIPDALKPKPKKPKSAGEGDAE